MTLLKVFSAVGRTRLWWSSGLCHWRPPLPPASVGADQVPHLPRPGAEHTTFPGTALLLWSDAQILHVGYVTGDLRALGDRGPEGRQSAPANGGRAGLTGTALPALGPRGSESVLAHLLRPRLLWSHSPGFYLSSHPHEASQTGPWALEGQTGLRILKLSLCGSRFRGAFCNWVWGV